MSATGVVRSWWCPECGEKEGHPHKAGCSKLPAASSQQTEPRSGHKWDFCVLCGPMVVCGYCGNNCCNGGSGENCPDKCTAAYKMQKANNPSEADLKALLLDAHKVCRDAVLDRAAVWGHLDLLGDADSKVAIAAIDALRASLPGLFTEAVRPRSWWMPRWLYVLRRDRFLHHDKNDWQQ